jgi:hypothetical protein
MKRGEFYLSMDFIQYWNEELEEMNKNTTSLTDANGNTTFYEYDSPKETGKL